MIKIDDTLLEEIGLITLPKVERDQMLSQIYETLEMRVGMRLAERMTDQQLDEFERFIDTDDEASALKWLETNFPDYKQVVASELDKLKAEIKQDSSKIIEAMQQAGALHQGQASIPTQMSQPQPMGHVQNSYAPQPQPIQQPQPRMPQQNTTSASFPQPQTEPQQHQNIPPPPMSPYDQDQQPPSAA